MERKLQQRDWRIGDFLVENGKIRIILGGISNKNLKSLKILRNKNNYGEN